MKFFQYSGTCHLNKALKTSAPSISLIVLLLATILILPSFAFAEVEKEYYPSGELKSEVNVINGKLEGLRKVYYENGRLQWEENYKNGKKNGVSREYYNNGEIRFIDTYKNDIKVNRKAYTEEGKLKFNQDYPE
tara:strand:+ start:265 stop:666 length:402 start_codon:yes stop_codon:yes gene_type:complete